MEQIHGNTEGIRRSVLETLSTLYDYPFEMDEFIPEELAALLARFSCSFNREIGLYVSRGGDVLDIVIGENDNVPLPSMRLRRSEKRLSMVRVIHTHPKDSARLSDVDLTALRSLYLDAICAIGTDDKGEVNGLQTAFLTEKKNGIPDIMVSDIVPLRRIPQRAWTEQILLSDALVMKGQEQVRPEKERAILVSIDSQASLDELEALAESAGAQVVGKTLQKRPKPDPACYVGSGKAAELMLDAQALEADLLIVDGEMTGAQLKNLEDAVSVKVIDRTSLILDIFAQRAKSGEGKLQVSIAQLKYQSSRLIGQGLILSRLAGGIGTRGPGESKLEMDRRRIRFRINELQKQLDSLEKQRALRRKTREKNKIPTAALVGYTNAGKSTLLNYLTDAGVYVQNQLFATLDAVSRKVKAPDGTEFLLTDTVGFISKLPTDLVEAFKSTLEEAAKADVLVIVSDLSNPDLLAQHRVVEQVLHDLGADSQPRIDVLNKCDAAQEDFSLDLPGAIPISAKCGTNIDLLVKKIAETLRPDALPVTLSIPFADYQAVSDLRAWGKIMQEEYTDTGTQLTVCLNREAMGRFYAKWGAKIPLPDDFLPPTEDSL